MKDTVITARAKKRELWILLACFVVANVTNWVAIIRFSAPWYEVFTQIGYVVVTSLVIYALIAVLRIAFKVYKLITRK
ncbi:MAG: hypothetical protein IIW65_03720 [Alistipes sp.]|jgi:hypothetical protein|nr:hypothetical protein [Alistipes sp.]